jgi:hypothetical protein
MDTGTGKSRRRASKTTPEAAVSSPTQPAGKSTGVAAAVTVKGVETPKRESNLQSQHQTSRKAQHITNNSLSSPIIQSLPLSLPIPTSSKDASTASVSSATSKSKTSNKTEAADKELKPEQKIPTQKEHEQEKEAKSTVIARAADHAPTKVPSTSSVTSSLPKFPPYPPPFSSSGFLYNADPARPKPRPPPGPYTTELELAEEVLEMPSWEPYVEQVVAMKRLPDSEWPWVIIKWKEQTLDEESFLSIVSIFYL